LVHLFFDIEIVFENPCDGINARTGYLSLVQHTIKRAETLEPDEGVFVFFKGYASTEAVRDRDGECADGSCDT